MKLLIGLFTFLSVLAALYLCADYADNRNMPEPNGIFSNYGFKPGIRVTRTEIKSDPFDVNLPKVDTLTVKAVKKGYVLFTNGETKRIGSIGMSWYEWEKVE
jgi:hypothetical protein